MRPDSLAFGDWTYSGLGTGALDTVVKHAGVSSFRSSHKIRSTGSYGNGDLTRDGFSCTQLRVILWVRVKYQTCSGSTCYSTVRAQVRHPGYGTITLMSISGYGTVTKEWEKWRASFWYDSAADTRFGRKEYWDGSVWVQDGDDINFGTGSPAAGSIVLRTYHGPCCSYGAWSYTWAWYDELEVYTA